MKAILLFELRSFISNKLALFWTLGYPVAMLIILIGLFSPDTQSESITQFFRFRIVVGIVALVIITTAIFGMCSILCEMRNNRSLLSYLFLPVSLFGIVNAIMLSRIIIIFLFSMLFIYVSFFALDIDLPLSLSQILKVTVAVLAAEFFSFSVVLPMVLISKNPTTVTALANIVNIYAIISSDIFFPIEALPEWSKIFVIVSPFYYLNLGLRMSFDETVPIAYWLGTVAVLFTSSMLLTYFSSQQKILVPPK